MASRAHELRQAQRVHVYEQTLTEILRLAHGGLDLAWVHLLHQQCNKIALQAETALGGKRVFNLAGGQDEPEPTTKKGNRHEP